MNESRTYRLSLAALLVATLLGCASATAPAASPRAPSGAPAWAAVSLEPTAADVRAGGRAMLSGEEFGRLWTFEDAPLERWKESPGVSVDAEWLERVRLATLRYGEYCTAAFVSPDGLALTNQHCARVCIEAASSREDLVTDGFLARNRRDERTCPGVYVDQLTGAEDVTARIRGRTSAVRGEDAAAAERSLREAIARVEDECEKEAPRARCQVVPLYHGARYTLYRYRRYEPVKLVFAPELQVAYFGGEHDNFTYPRHAFDVTFIRVYDGDSPVDAEAYLPLHPAGADEGDAVFAVGNPGSTSRMMTVSEVMYERAYRLPLRIWVLGAQKRALEAAMAANPALESELRQDVFEVSNALKAYGGMLDGLRDTLLVGAKIRMEEDLRGRLESESALHAEYGDVWQRIEALQWRKLEVSARLNAANVMLVGSPQLELAGTLVGFVRQSQLPETSRDPRFRGETGRRVRASLESHVPLDPTISRLTLTAHLEFIETWIPAGDPLRRLLLRPGESVEAAAKRLTAETRVGDVAFRRTLIEGGTAAVEASVDPLVAFARRALPDAEALRAEWETLLAEEYAQRRRVGLVLLALEGVAVPPDATFTLRISDGVVKRYASSGTWAPAATSFYGLWARAAEFDDEEPWNLPESFERARSRIDMDTPLNFVATTDITGGSSGSPVVDAEGRLVGVVFDSNIEQLPNDYLYRSETGRAIAVHAAGILEALRSVYRASGLVAELTRARGR